MSEIVINALRSKRAEIAGYIHDLEGKARAWRARLAHLDATIRTFSPDTDPETIPPKMRYRRSRYFQRGEFSRLVMDHLREAQNPISAADIATAILAAKGLPIEGPTLDYVREKAVAVLRGLGKRGTVTRTAKGREALWALQ